MVCTYGTFANVERVNQTNPSSSVFNFLAMMTRMLIKIIPGVFHQQWCQHARAPPTVVILSKLNKIGILDDFRHAVRKQCAVCFF